MGGVTPPEVADNLAKISVNTLRMVSELRTKQGDNKELRLTLGDMEAMGYLAGYYSARFVARWTWQCSIKAPNRRIASLPSGNLQLALEAWKRYARAYTVAIQAAFALQPGRSGRHPEYGCEGGAGHCNRAFVDTRDGADELKAKPSTSRSGIDVVSP